MAHDNVIDILLKLGAIKYKDFDHEIDFTMFGIDFDLKLTRYPRDLWREFNGNPIKTRADKNEAINWLYNNQSQQGRKHLGNKLFVMVGKEEDRYNTDAIQEKLIAFSRYYQGRKIQSSKYFWNERICRTCVCVRNNCGNSSDNWLPFKPLTVMRGNKKTSIECVWESENLERKLKWNYTTMIAYQF